MKKKKNQLLLYLAISVFAVILFAYFRYPVLRGTSSMIDNFCVADPNIADFPIEPEDWYLDKPASPNFSNSEINATHQVMIRRAVARGVNFAGKYVVTEWGCGTSCQRFAVINAKTGKIIATDLESSHGAEYQKNSFLLVVNPQSSWSSLKTLGLQKTKYYLVKDDELKPYCE